MRDWRAESISPTPSKAERRRTARTSTLIDRLYRIAADPFEDLRAGSAAATTMDATRDALSFHDWETKHSSPFPPNTRCGFRSRASNFTLVFILARRSSARFRLF